MLLSIVVPILCWNNELFMRSFDIKELMKLMKDFFNDLKRL